MGKSKNPRLDVFNVGMVCGAEFVGAYGFPQLEKSSYVPLRLISFPKFGKADETQWIHPYVEDYEFYRLWRDRNRYLKYFLRAAGAITPDFSISLDMPPAQQIYSVYQSRAVGYWLQSNGVKVIPNVRWGDSRTYHFAFDGIATGGGTVAVGTLGCMRDRQIRNVFQEGFDEMIARIRPETIVVYGGVTRKMEESARQGSIRLVQFSSQCDNAHRNRVA